MSLGRRVASAAVLLAVLVAALWVGGPLVDVVAGVAVAVAAWEYADLMRRAGTPVAPIVLYPLTLWLLYRFLLPGDVPALEWGLGAAAVVGLLGGLTVPHGAAGRWAAAVGGAVYLGLCIGYLLTLLAWPEAGRDHLGFRIVAITLGSAMVGDTAALFAGRAFGRHPFFARISPKKTVEGAVGGAAGTVLAWAVAAPAAVGLGVGHAVLLGVLVTIAAQGGDLVESALKRTAGVKDSSNLIPGHGGLLDRLDSLVLLGPVVYCYLRLVHLP